MLDSHGITHEFIPPDTPQYNGVAERALGLLREKSIAMPQEMTVAASGRLWAEALNHACDMSNMCVTSSLEGGTSPYEKWYGRKPSLQYLQPFGTVEYVRKGKRAHKLAPRGEQCVMLGIAHNHPRDTVKVLVFQTGQIVNRQTISWHPETATSGPISPAPVGNNNTAEPVGVRGSTIEAYTPTKLAQEVEEESESSEPPSSPGPQCSEQMETGKEESSDQESEPMVEPATIPAAVRKLADHFTGEVPFVIHGRTRSGGGVDSRARSGEIDGGPSAFSGIYWKDKRNSIALGAMFAASGANHTRQNKRKPIILSQCKRHLLYRRTSRVVSLKSHQPFAKPKRAPSGRIGRER